MTREELAKLLHKLTWALDDAGHRNLAWMYEDAYVRVAQGYSDEVLRVHADYLLPSGKRGHVRLVLESPYHARATAALVCLLRNFRAF